MGSIRLQKNDSEVSQTSGIAFDFSTHLKKIVIHLKNLFLNSEMK